MTPQERYDRLKAHLSEENIQLIEVIEKYEILDNIGHKTGLLDTQQSYTDTISWWPLISILGTFSAGKSSFINQYLNQNVQESGNQAVDDKFTVLSYGNNEEVVTLPGLALDADPRFPFYNISDEINKVEKGEGNRVSLYLQLKTVKSDMLKGKILIDSPGFDADSQRDTVLRITSHIIDMSDLVLVFFDARHPEPGAMRDTLEHLVGAAMHHSDADKILYILNQIDTTAREDNLEDVIGAWQRALSQKGLMGGNFYAVYNEAQATQIDDPSLAERLKRKKDNDLHKITSRMEKVRIERAYRIIRTLEDIAKTYKDEKLPALQKILQNWSRKVLWADLFLLGVFLAAGIVAEIKFEIVSSLFSMLSRGTIVSSLTSILILAVLLYLHFSLRKFVALLEIAKLQGKDPDMVRAVKKNTRWQYPLIASRLKNWERKKIQILDVLSSYSKQAIQNLNDEFISPSGKIKT